MQAVNQIHQSHILSSERQISGAVWPEANLVKCLSCPLLQICKSGLGSNLIGPVLKYACHYPIAAPSSPGHESLRVRNGKGISHRARHPRPSRTFPTSLHLLSNATLVCAHWLVPVMNVYPSCSLLPSCSFPYHHALPSPFLPFFLPSFSSLIPHQLSSLCSSSHNKSEIILLLLLFLYYSQSCFQLLLILLF